MGRFWFTQLHLAPFVTIEFSEELIIIKYILKDTEEQQCKIEWKVPGTQWLVTRGRVRTLKTALYDFLACLPFSSVGIQVAVITEQAAKFTKPRRQSLESVTITVLQLRSSGHYIMACVFKETTRIKGITK